MTEVNGLRLAYRGFVAGLAGGYVWMGIAMVLAALVHGDPLRPLRPFALAISPEPVATSFELSFVLGLMGVQAAGALLGMSFAYFFGRYFTTRVTLRAAAACVAVLAWGLIMAAVPRVGTLDPFGVQLVPLAATLGYGLVLGAWIPVRGEVTRYSGSPST